MSQFERQASFEVEYAPAKISKWKSSRTGLQLVYIDHPSPIVSGHFAVATEIADDSGCPHTLEHLVFMGSNKFPYKGLLDSLSNRFFSSTNAWTSVDQTVYTLTTAGWEGFKTLLPIYLDHLLNPTLTDEACLTEVYHIDGKGKEKGVVFSEMQGIETQSWFIAYMNLQRSMYAKNSGYSSETGGLMSELRHLTNDQIRDFHHQMYRPNNLCVVVSGTVNEAELLQVISEFDDQLAPSTTKKRPFVDSVPDLPLQKRVVTRVTFPDEDESMAELNIAWIGPDCNDVLSNLAVDMVGAYFADSPISIFNKNLVEIEEPLSTEIVFGTDDFLRTALNFSVGGVPTESLDFVDSEINRLILEQTDPSKFDLKHMRQVINQQKLKHVAHTEKDASSFSNVAILDFIYGESDGSTLAAWTRDLKEYSILAEWTTQQWCDFIKEYLVENKSATSLAKPSRKLNKQMKKDDKQRLRSIKERYGPDGLAELGAKLELAKQKNDTPIPNEILTQFGKPDPSKIQFIKTESYRAGSNDGSFADYKDTGVMFEHLKKDSLQDLPLYLHFENYKSNFVTVHLMLSSTQVPVPLLKYFSLVEEIFSLSIQLPNGEYLPYDEVISQINEDLIEFHFDNGIDNQFAELSGVRITFETQKYEKAIQWLINVLKYSVFEEERIKVLIEKNINSLPDKKRGDEHMLYSMQYRRVFTDSSLRKAQDCINTEEFYKDLLQKCNNGRFHEIRQDLEKIRECLFRVSNMKVFVVGGCSKLERPASSWSQFSKEFASPPSAADFSLSNIPRAFNYKTEIGKQCSRKAFVLPRQASDSSYLLALTPIPTDYLNEDIFKIALTSEFLEAVEGPFWRAIRGTGLAYGANVARLIESGYLTFNVYRGADSQQAWVVAKDLITKYANGELDIDQISIDNSIAAIVNTLANNEASNYEAGMNRIIDTIFKKRGSHYIDHFLGKLNSYTKEDMVYVLRKYFLPLFSAETSMIFTTVPAAKSQVFTDFLTSEGFEVAFEEISLHGSESSDHKLEDDSDESDESGSDESGSDESDESGSDESDESGSDESDESESDESDGRQ